MKTDVITLIESKQVYEMSDKELFTVKRELLRMVYKIGDEQNLRFEKEESQRGDYYQSVLNQGAY